MTQVIQTTPDHPFYVAGLGFTNAQDLYAGEKIEDASGGYTTVVSSISQADPSGVTVYNFTVANDHTYFVDQGGDAVWVHNVIYCSSDPLVGDLANEIERLYPGHVVGVNVPLYDAAGNLATDADIVLQNAVIQVKSGSKAQGILAQLTKSEALTGKTAVGFGPKFSNTLVRNLNGMGGLVTNIQSDLLAAIAP
jgi:hypothetical protein